MGFMQSLNKENISIDFYLEINKIFMALSTDEKLKLEQMLIEPDFTASPILLFLLGVYYDSNNSNEMLQYYYLLFYSFLK